MPNKKKTKITPKRKEKRKATSPILESTAQCSKRSGKTGSTSSESKQHSKEVDTSGTDCESNVLLSDSVPYEMSNMNSMSMNYPPHMYGPPGMQSTAGVPPYAAPPTTPPNMSIPTWASALMDDIKSIKSTVSSVEKTVNTMNLKFYDLEKKVSNIDNRVSEVEQSCSFISSKFETLVDENKRSQAAVKKMEGSLKSLEDQMKPCTDGMNTLKKKLSDLESRSMRNNLIFYGIEERTSEDCEMIVKTFIKDKLSIDSDMLLDRAHRLGNNLNSSKPRPVIARFHYYKDRETVRTKAYELNTTLKQTGNGVSIQRTKEERDARKSLMDVMRQERDKGNDVRLDRGKLYVNGRLYQTPTATP